MRRKAGGILPPACSLRKAFEESIGRRQRPIPVAPWVVLWFDTRLTRPSDTRIRPPATLYPARRPRLALALSAFTTLVALACEPGEARRASTPAIDLVIVTLDTTRADHLGTYGYFRDTSPTLDALAMESLVFERHVVPIATTLPTHTTLFTGAHPTEHGVLANVERGGHRVAPAPGLSSFAAFALDAGYRTAAFVSAIPLRRGSGVEQGFEHFDEPKEKHRPGAETTERALAWLRELPVDVRFLLWVHYFDPHGPFEPPAPYSLRYETDDALEAHLSDRRFADGSERPFRGRPVDTRTAINGYDGEIRYMDAQLERLLAGLRERGRWDSIALLVLGDHGESLGQHGVPGHGGLWHEQLRAPLLMRGPGIAPGRSPALISTADVLPTWLHQIELPGREEWLRRTSGRNVLSPGTERLFAISRTSERKVEFGRPLGFAITGLRWKLVIGTDGDETLYDLEEDPYELAPVTGEPATRAALREALADAVQRRRQRALELGRGRSRRLPQEELDRLEQLGYVSNDRPTPGDAAR